MPPAVSVVIPTRDRASLLRRAIASVLAQSYADFELLVVDDASTDDTADVVAAFGDARLRMLRQGTPGGQSRAMNAGIAAAAGRYVAFLDDDDEWLSDKLAAQVARMDAGPAGVGLVYCWRDVVDDRRRGAVRTVRKRLRGDVLEQALAYDVADTPSGWLVRTAAARSLGGFEAGRGVANDVDFAVRLSLAGWHVDFVSRVGVVKHEHGTGQMSGETRAKLAAHAAHVREHMARFEVELGCRPAARARVRLCLANYEMRSGRPAAALGSAAAALLASPRAVLALAARNPHHARRALALGVRNATRPRR